MNIYHAQNLIKDLASKKGMTMTRVADESGIHVNTIYNYTKNGAQPPWGNMVAIIESMGYKITIEKDNADI